jgi:hypothetical protein
MVAPLLFENFIIIYSIEVATTTSTIYNKEMDLCMLGLIRAGLIFKATSHPSHKRGEAYNYYYCYVA